MKSGAARFDLAAGAVHLEATFSPAEVGLLLGLKARAVSELVRIGRERRGVHPRRGGLWPTFKASHKSRRIPARAIDSHLRALAAASGEPVPPPVLVVRAA